MKTTLHTIFTLALILSATFSCAADDFIQIDIKGHADHPLLKRFAGSIMVAGDKRSFDEFTVALGRVEFDYAAQQFKPWDKEKAEGARHTAFYRMPKDVTTLEALKNYENDLKAKEFEILYCGSAKELDNGYGRFAKQVYTSHQDNHLMQYVMPAAEDYRYLAMRKVNQDGSRLFFTGFFTLVPSGWSSKFARAGDTVARIDLLETKPVTQRMVAVKAEEMAEQIDASGKVALYGIFFDFNKTDVKAESEPTLAEVAKYLGSNPAVRLLVAGHTDNAGSFEFNRDLSQRRAQSVVEYLSSHYQVSRERLFPFGVSFASPAATNATEEGKAKNRRVELVRY